MSSQTRNLNRLTAGLKAMGLQPLLDELLAGPLPAPRELPFASLRVAKTVMRDLYGWLWFFPDTKARTSLRLNDTTAVLTITPKIVSEKEGGIKLPNTDDKNNGNKKPGLDPMDTMPKVVAQVIINLHHGGRVTGNMPTDMKVTMYMLGEFFKQIGPTLEYKQPSSIVVAPPGLKIK